MTKPKDKNRPHAKKLTLRRETLVDLDPKNKVKDVKGGIKTVQTLTICGSCSCAGVC